MEYQQFIFPPNKRTKLLKIEFKLNTLVAATCQEMNKSTTPHDTINPTKQKYQHITN